MKHSNTIKYAVGTTLVLLIPLIAMQFTDEVQWEVGDFIVIGTLLMGAGIVYELVSTKLHARHRPVVAVIFIAGVLLIWAELAVGILNTPLAGS